MKRPLDRHCNQCGCVMSYSAEVLTDNGVNQIPVCTTPACPNYALLQISAEQMPKEKLTLKKIKQIDKKFFNDEKGKKK